MAVETDHTTAKRTGPLLIIKSSLVTEEDSNVNVVIKHINMSSAGARRVVRGDYTSPTAQHLRQKSPR